MFSGFPLAAIAFFEGLAADNSKAYFAAHRDQYERCVREPLEDLVAELSRDHGAAKVFRPNRDVRFSKDKAPYKLAAAAVARRDDAACGATYVEISAAGLRTGGGVIGLDRGQLERARRAIDDPKSGQALESIARSAEEGGMTLIGPELKTAPRGFPKDHPRIALLRRKSFAAVALHAPGPWLATPEAKERVIAGWQASAPLIAWLERHVGPADPVERR